MSFFGKQFKKVKVEGGTELLGRLDLSEQVLAILRHKDTVTTFSKNDDGTLQYEVKAGGETVLNQKIVLDKEIDYTTPDGIATKVFFSLQGDLLKSYMKFPNVTVHTQRQFEAKGMKLDLSVEGSSTKATILYEVL